MKAKSYLWGMTAVLLAATALRLVALGTVPPGLYHDEAAHGLDALDVLQGDLPRVRGTRGQLEAALWAILQKSWNSLLPRGGTITLRTWEEEGSVWCTIASHPQKWYPHCYLIWQSKLHGTEGDLNQAMFTNGSPIAEFTPIRHFHLMN